MQLTAKLHPIVYMNGLPHKDFKVDVEVKEVEDYAQLVEAVENAVWDQYGVNVRANQDFTIVNDKALCEELHEAQEDLL